MTLHAVAQKIVPNETIELGKNAYAFQMSNDMGKALLFYTDSVSSQKSNLMVGLYDLNNKTFNWTQKCARKIPYWRLIQGNRVSTGSKLTKYGSLIADNGHCKLISNDGNILWDIKLELAYANGEQDILLGYSNISSSKLIAYRISDGKKLWEHKVSHSKCWGWNNMLRANDSLLIVPADNLYFINTMSGEVKTYDTQNAFQRTGNMLMKAIAAGAALGAVGAMMGTTIYPIYYPQVYSEDVVTETCSNVYPMNGNYYFTDRDRLSCLNAGGDTIWTHEFPSRIMGKAVITGNGKRITVVNYAYGLKAGYEKFPCGKPFIASYNANNGDQQYINYLSDGKEMAVDGYVDENNAFIIFPDRIIHKNLNNKKAVGAEWNTKAYGDLVSIPTDSVFTYRLNDETLTPLHCDSTHCIVITDKNNLKVVDSSLKITDDYQAGNMYHELFGNDSLLLVTNEDGDGNGKYFIIKDNGEPVGSLDFKIQDAQLSGNDIFVLSDKHILKIDLGNIRTE